MDAPQKPHHWWKRLRLSVRTLMILVLIIGGVLGSIVHQAHIQRDAVSAILKAGGNVNYDGVWGPLAPHSLKQKKRWPSWLVDTVGRDYFENVVTVDLKNAKEASADDALMAHIGRLERIVYLTLNDCTSVTDAGLSDLSRLTNLESLRIGSPQITDIGLAHLKKLVNLEELSIRSPRITSSGLHALRDMQYLRSLYLEESSVTDIAPISHLSELTDLGLASSKIEDAGLRNLRDLRSLRSLYLGGTGITDAGLAHIAGLTELESLDLINTPVSDAGLAHLCDLKKLERVMNLVQSRCLY